ncbi:MAG: hypothetical protein ACLGPL_04450 [Acidobacteriota bacterium]
MEKCKACELAVYCYSESSTWIFRTKQEMEEKQAEMCRCPIHEKVEQIRSEARKAARMS